MEGSLFGGSNLIAAVEVFTAIAVVVGIIFGLVELRQATRNRRDHAAVDIVRTVQTQEVRQAVRQIFDLPLDADPQLIRNDPELLAAALAVDSACEMWGCMVFEGVVDHKLLDRMVGGWVRGTWTRLRAWVESERAETQSVNVGEWWQWLYELLESDPDLGKKLGAHISYRGKKTR
jgi:hypothetical protein